MCVYMCVCVCVRACVCVCVRVRACVCAKSLTRHTSFDDRRQPDTKPLYARQCGREQRGRGRGGGVRGGYEGQDDKDHTWQTK